MVSTDAQAHTPEATPGTVNLPAPTPWPVILAFGITLLFAGLVTSPSVSILGAILFVTGCVGWFRDVLPQEKEETVDVKAEVTVISPSHREIERLPIAPDLPRALLPLETYPVSAGIKGGLAGSVAMAVLACLYGLLKQGSIWYPINLLAATGYAQSLKIGTASLDAVPFGQLRHGCFHSSDHLAFSGLTVRSHATDVSTPTDSSGRRLSADSVDRIAPQRLRADKPTARRAY